MGRGTYILLEVVWALPIIVMQWLLGLDVMIRRWKVWLPGIVIPTIYLTLIDSIPLGAHTWTINPDFSLNLFLPLGVPIEEGVFFLVTNTLVVQGLILFTTPGMWTRVQRLWRVLRYGPKALSANSVSRKAEHD